MINKTALGGSLQKKIGIVLLVVIVILLAYFIFDFRNNKKSDATPKPDAVENIQKIESQSGSQGGSAPNIIGATNTEVENIIKKVYRHVFLPSGDVRVEKVVKPDDLRRSNPIFYQNVKEGDYLLIYADRAILYDPVVDKVLDIFHISTNDVESKK